MERKLIEGYKNIDDFSKFSADELAAHLLALAEMEPSYSDLAELQEIAEKYGDIDEAGQPLDTAKAKWIEENLTDDDVEAWHSGNCTDHTRQLMSKMQIDCIQIWGSSIGPEPLSVNLC